jgi:transketolase
MAGAVRALAIDAVERAKSGHPGMPLGMADVATVLFSDFMKFDPTTPDWPDRDRFVLSAGHGSMLLYAILHLLGVEAASLDELKNFRQLGSKAAGHPEYGHMAGVETTTGPLGQGLATAVGMALAESMLNAEFGDELVNHRTYVIAGDGCLMEGISHEAISLAGHLALRKLVVLWDDNGISIDGPLSLSESGDQKARFGAAGWNTLSVDGHDAAAIHEALARAKLSDRPTLIACKTIIGFGSPNRAGTASVHGAPLGVAEATLTRAALKWTAPAFEMPEESLAAWREVGRIGTAKHQEWLDRQRNLKPELLARFKDRLSGAVPGQVLDALRNLKVQFFEKRPQVAGRKSSEAVLEHIAPLFPGLVGGSADLTHSNLTLAKSQQPFSRDLREGRYIHYGIREFGMAAAMNGLALHGGFVPCGGTFFVFSDYARPAIRLSALMGLPVVYVMTHDSIGLGEDGPTHQPVEHLASFRAMPNLTVIRPCDAVEVAEAWEIALKNVRPTMIVLSRQSLNLLRAESTDENLSSRGAYSVEGGEQADVTIFASGSEVAIALKASALLATVGYSARTISVPSFDLFDVQDEGYRRKVIGNSRVYVAVEAGSSLGWSSLIGRDGIFVGMETFGASGKAEELYAHFGITPEAIVDRVLAKLSPSNVPREYIDA